MLNFLLTIIYLLLFFWLRVENLSGTVVTKKPDTVEMLDSQPIQRLPSSSGYVERVNSNVTLQQHSSGKSYAVPDNSDKSSTLRSATINRKAFSVQDKVHLAIKSIFPDHSILSTSKQ